MPIRSKIVGVGGYLPPKCLTNQDLEKTLDTTDAWIQARTGMTQRHIADQETTSDLAYKAAVLALEHAKISSDAIDMIIVATVSPDHPFPACATRVQAKLGAHRAFAFDVNAVCSGFIYALSMADQYLRTGMVKNALVIGADVMSKLVDWSDRSTAILFGDGAGAVVLEASDQSDSGIYSTHLFSDGRRYDLLYVDTQPANVDQPGHIRMQGREIYKLAITRMGQAITTALEHNQLSIDDVAWFIPHQANLRIIEGLASHFKVPMEKMIITIDQHSNTSAATIPLALWVAINDGRIQKNQWIVLEAMGGGLTWGSAVIKW